MIIHAGHISIWIESLAGGEILKAIFASKLYKASPRKDHIKAQLSDPINKELVQQLRSYLDEEYLQPDFTDNSGVSVQGPDDDFDMDTGTGPSTSAPSGPSGRYSSGGGSGVPGLTYENEGSDGEFDAPESEDGSDNTSEPDVDVPGLNIEDESDDSTDVQEDEPVEQSKKVTASKNIVNDLSSAVEQIKGTLNAQIETSGVNRILVKDKQELWVYYNDDINLNNVMGPVIELLNAAGFTYLAFNRLARSDNAIVFEIQLISTNTVEAADNEK